MKLYNDDKLSLDDRVSKHLSWFGTEGDQIRIHHKLAHSSGITRDGETGHWFNLTFPSSDKIKAQIPEGINYFNPSENLKYSNFGYTILGQIIEAVSGKSYTDFINEEILGPLEMRDTFVDVEDSNESQHVTGHKRRLPRIDRETFPHVNANVMHSATGFSSTVDDLIKFYKAHMMGNDILFPGFIKREMQSPQFYLNNEKRGYGFGY